MWEADPKFLAEHRAELTAVKGDVLSKIVRNALLDGQARVARQAIRQRRRLHARSNARAAMYSLLAYIPGGSRSLRLARSAVHVLHNAAAVVTTIASWLSDW